MRLTKIYTKIGDKGSTLLGDGQRVEKDDARIEAYGTLDELNAVAGCLVDSLKESESCAPLIPMLLQIQHEIFDLGAELSLPRWEEQKIKLSIVGSEQIARLEQQIDQFNAELSALPNFVLPGGVMANSFAHLARTVCRRAERRVVSLQRSETVRGELLVYLNRLSDWFFVAGRYISKSLSVPEVIWRQRR